MHIPRLVVAGAQSNSGKTTVTLALLAALRRHNMECRPFKVGPDYIDPMFHRAASGWPSHNLDVWLLPEPAVRKLFVRHATSSRHGLAVIEGVMGLFDGLGTSARCSTAHVASLLQAPVLLVVDASGMSLSAAALVSGFAVFRPCGPSEPDLGGLRLGGVILNRVSGEKHYRLLQKAVETQTGIPCLGWLPKSLPALPRRHLGLVPADEQDALPQALERLADAAQAHLDLERIIALAAGAPALPLPEAVCDATPLHQVQQRNPSCASEPATRIRLGIASDAAFSFYYQDNLDYLVEQGVEPVFFSPLADKELPDGLNGLYLGGGYPEIFAEGLAANAGFRESLRLALEGGLPCYAECGGMIYLCRELITRDKDGHTSLFPMADFFPQSVEMTGRLQHFGYITVTLGRDCILGRSDDRFPAHEFHYSRLHEPLPDHDAPALMEKPDGRAWTGGLCRVNVFAMYPHLHFRGCPGAAASFLHTCQERQRTEVPSA